MSKIIAMAPGLSLLIQGLLGFAPLMAGVVKSRQASSSLLPMADLHDLFQGVSGLVESAQADSQLAAERQQQQQLAAYQRETQLKLAAYQRETILKLPEAQRILDNWPLRLYPAQLLASHPAQGPLPLRIFLAFRGEFSLANQGSPFDLEARLAQGLRGFLSQHYPLQSPIRPTEFLAGAWENQRFHSEASIKALFGALQSEPTLILESELDGQTLIFRVAYWGPGQDTYYYKTIAQWSYLSLLKAAARSQALAWKAVRDHLLSLGETPATLEPLASAPAANLELLDKEAFWQAEGVDLDALQLPYQINAGVMEAVCQLLIRYHNLVAAWMADSYHLVYRDVPPLLPTLLPDLIANHKGTLLQATDLTAVLTPIFASYQQIYQALEDERRYWVPELALQFAQSLSQWPDPSLARQQLEVSLQAWLHLRQLECGPSEALLAAVLAAATGTDRPYLDALHHCLATLGDGAAVEQITTRIEALDAAALAQGSSARSPAFIQVLCHPLQTLVGYSGQPALVAISPAGDRLVTDSLNQQLQVWTLPNGEPYQTLKGHRQPISSVAISPDGQFLASSSLHCPKSNVRIWDWQTGKLLHDRLGHKKSVRLVAMDGLGRIVSASSDKIKLWDIKTGKRLGTLSHPGVINTLAMSADGKLLATGSPDGKIRLWQISKAQVLRTLRGHTGAIHALAFGPDGETLLSASADQTLRVWHLATGQLIHTLQGHGAAVNAIALQADRNLLISGSSDTTLKFWRLDNWALQHTLSEQRGAITALALSADGQFLASGSADNTVKLWRF